MIDANARRARVLELLRQATIAQVELWALQTRLERAMLDGKEMADKPSDEVLEFIKMLAAGAPTNPSELYGSITDEHVTELFRRVDGEKQTPLHVQMFQRYDQYKRECKENNTAYVSYQAWREWASDVTQAVPSVTPDACARYNDHPQCGRTLYGEDLRAGLVVRYDHGVTALAKLTAPHAGGWHGAQCMGGSTYISTRQIREATDLDQEIWNECAKWRK
jgi:hypothetical protein